MDQIELIEILENKFLNEENKTQRILINGSWGIGKSVCWNEFKKKVEAKNDLLKETKSKEEKIIKVIKVSLFGISSLEALEKKIKIAYYKVDNKVGKGIQQALEAVNKKFAGGAIDPFAFVSLGDDCIICFDDLERKSEKLSMKDIMGFIEETAQNSRVLIIVNESELDQKDKVELTSYKEKIIDSEYNLTTISESVCFKLLDGVKFDEDIKRTIVTTFRKFGNNNLRTLLKIKRLIENLHNIFPEINSELTRICSAVVIDEYSKKKNQDDGNTNPILRFSPYNINYRHLSLVDEITTYLKENKINHEKIKQVLNPDKHEIDQLIDTLYEIHLYDLGVLNKTINQSIDFINEKKGPFINPEYVLFLVGFVKYYNNFFQLNIVSTTQTDFENRALEIIKMIITNIEIDEEFKKSLSRLKLNSLFVSKDVTSEITNLIKLTVNAMETEDLNRKVKKVDDYFQQKKYQECFELLADSPHFIQNRIHFYDELLKEPNRDYFNNLKTFTGQVSDPQLKQRIEKYLLSMKLKIKDSVVTYRIDLVLDQLNEK